MMIKAKDAAKGVMYLLGTIGIIDALIYSITDGEVRAIRLVLGFIFN